MQKSYDIKAIKIKLKKTLRPGRYYHSLGVMETGESLARHYGIDPLQAKIAGLLHDCAKNKEDFYMQKFRCQEMGNAFKDYPAVFHSFLGAIVAKEEYGVQDEEILQAIKFHTTGRPNMNMLEKIIFVSDMIEPNRRYSGIQPIRNLVYRDIDQAVLMSLDNSLEHVFKIRKPVCLLTVKTRNYYIKHREEALDRQG